MAPAEDEGQIEQDDAPAHDVERVQRPEKDRVVAENDQKGCQKDDGNAEEEQAHVAAAPVDEQACQRIGGPGVEMHVRRHGKGCRMDAVEGDVDEGAEEKVDGSNRCQVAQGLHALAHGMRGLGPVLLRGPAPRERPNGEETA